MADRSLVPQCFGTAKLGTQISGQGHIPPGLDALVMGTAYTVKCFGPRTISSSTTTITLPTKRSDVDVIYTALDSTKTLVSWDGSTPVVGALAYRATYVPQFDGYLTRKFVDGDIYGASWSWQLTFEES
jgi:hypothetical protein